MKSVPALHTNRCTLSAITQSDIPVLRQILDDAETQRFLPELCEEFQTLESLQKFVASFDKYLAQDEGILWGIRKDGTLIGFIAIMDIMTNPTLFYAMHPKHRNNGYTKECIIAALQFVNKINLCRIIQTEVYRDNEVSDRLLKNLNFRPCKQTENKVYYAINLSKIDNSYAIHSK